MLLLLLLFILETAVGTPAPSPTALTCFWCVRVARIDTLFFFYNDFNWSCNKCISPDEVTGKMFCCSSLPWVF